MPPYLTKEAKNPPVKVEAGKSVIVAKEMATQTSSALKVTVKISTNEYKSVPIDEVEALITKLCADHEIGSQGVGLICQEKLFSGVRKPGKPHDELINKLVIEAEEPTKQAKDGKQQVVYCVGCRQKFVRQNPNQIKQHAKECNNLSKTFPGLYAKVMENLVKHVHTTKLKKLADQMTGYQTR
ncbi:hypothetical protein CPB84DRAFT_1750205 [Gymnopilus junonius]|uniref:Uncharacterized protein n=1 Tax=Gymnopilus junonius TaxID=109634 RepID=A0A9P5TIK5_GYMJU|nr:hypothetical protein CPB84DRAFT_1750205 [Gymnopilus junonius]